MWPKKPAHHTVSILTGRDKERDFHTYAALRSLTRILPNLLLRCPRTRQFYHCRSAFLWVERKWGKDHADMTQNSTGVKIIWDRLCEYTALPSYMCNSSEQWTEDQPVVGVVTIETPCSSREDLSKSKWVMKLCVSIARSRYSYRTVTLIENSASSFY